MLEGLPSAHPPSWTSHTTDRPQTLGFSPRHHHHQRETQSNGYPSNTPASLRGRAYTSSKADLPSSNLFVSLDFLHHQVDDKFSEKSRGRLESLLHRTSHGSAFWDSPDLDGSSGSEGEWKRSFASDTDPIHKTAHRSSSRDPPPVLSTSESSRDRLLSTPRHHPWATDTSSPLRQALECTDQGCNAKRGQSDPTRNNASNGVSIKHPQQDQLAAQSNAMSSSPGQTRTGMASSPPYLATMQEEAWDAHYPFRSTGTTDPRVSVRNRSTSSAAALQQVDRTMAQRGNSSDSFSRSISLWKGEYGGMSPGTYASRAAFQADSPTFSAGHVPLQSQSQAQWERGRRNEYIAPAFDTFSEEEDLRELGVGGTESRRHSIAADPASTTLIGQRRAIGFEVGRPHPSSASRNSSVGRPGANPLSAQPGSYSGSNMFGGGGLAITDDDLSFDLHKLNLNFDGLDMSRQQPQQQYPQQGTRPITSRIHSSNAAIIGGHASSVPTANFGRSPPLASRTGKWPVSAGFRDDETTTSWSDMVSSPGTTSSIHNDYQQHLQARGDILQQDTRTDDRKTALSATAKAFHGSNSMTLAKGLGGPSQSQPQAQAYAQSPVPPAYVARQSSQERRSDFATSPPSKSFSQFDRQPQSIPATTSTLSDTAIASLVTLGPLAPASGGPSDGHGGSLQELGKGVPLQMLPRSTTLYVVEFKAGRTDLYFRQQQGPQEEIRKGDLVIVEADRGKDLGTVVNDSITVEQVQGFLSHQAELAQGTGSISHVQQHNGNGDSAPHPAAIALSRLSRSINPKRLFSKASPGDTTLLHSKTQDEERALSLCTTKVNQRGLPMSVVAAEFQWDRRKLTFYYTATSRVDFRDLVKELFRSYKSRIYMCHLSHQNGNASSIAINNNTLPS